MTSKTARRVPLRTCVICGNKTDKRALVRIAATPDGKAVVDPTGKKPGRGAYVCKDGNCLSRGLKRGRLEHALRAKLGDEDFKVILSAIGSLSAAQGVTGGTQDAQTRRT
jgi:predicted RNA-binding protein YlxR (DUF448 family)